MVKTEKYKESVMAILDLCRHINTEIGSYRSHYLCIDCAFMVDLDNGTLKIPLNLVSHFNTEITDHKNELILNTASGFKPTNTKHRSYKKILEDWKNLFSDKRKTT